MSAVFSPEHKEEWVSQASTLLLAYMTSSEAKEYAKDLYQTFVIDFDDIDCTPGDAVDEDISNWGD